MHLWEKFPAVPMGMAILSYLNARLLARTKPRGWREPETRKHLGETYTYAGLAAMGAAHAISTGLSCAFAPLILRGAIMMMAAGNEMHREELARKWTEAGERPLTPGDFPKAYWAAFATGFFILAAACAPFMFRTTARWPWAVVPLSLSAAIVLGLCHLLHLHTTRSDIRQTERWSRTSGAARQKAVRRWTRRA